MQKEEFKLVQYCDDLFFFLTATASSLENVQVYYKNIVKYQAITLINKNLKFKI